MSASLPPVSLVVEEGSAHRVDLVHVTGPDAKSFLDSQISQDLGAMDDGSTAWALVLEPDGHLGALVHVVHLTSDHLVILGAQGSSGAMDAEGLLSRLLRFKIRVRADVSVGAGLRVVGHGLVELPARLPGVAEHLVLESDSDRFTDDVVGRRAIFDGQVVSETAPIGLTPLGLGSSMIAKAVSFTKGCYTGQELVARMDARVAAPPRRLVRFTGEAPGLSAAPSLDGLDGASLVAVAVDPASGRFGGVIEIPRKIESLTGCVVQVDGYPATVMELSSGTEG